MSPGICASCHTNISQSVISKVGIWAGYYMRQKCLTDNLTSFSKDCLSGLIFGRLLQFISTLLFHLVWFISHSVYFETTARWRILHEVHNCCYVRTIGKNSPKHFVLTHKTSAHQKMDSLFLVQAHIFSFFFLILFFIRFLHPTPKNCP